MFDAESEEAVLGRPSPRLRRRVWRETPIVAVPITGPPFHLRTPSCSKMRSFEETSAGVRTVGVEGWKWSMWEKSMLARCLLSVFMRTARTAAWFMPRWMARRRMRQDQVAVGEVMRETTRLPTYSLFSSRNVGEWKDLPAFRVVR